MLAFALAVMLCADPPAGFQYRPLPEGGVAVVAPDGQTVQVLLKGTPIARVYLEGDTLVVIEARQLATLYSLARPEAPEPLGSAAPPSPAATPAAATPATAAPAPAPPAALDTGAKGHVLKVEGGRVIFELERGALAPGAHVKVVSQRPVQKPDLTTGQMRTAPSNEVIAVLSVEEIDGPRAMAPLGRGDFAELNDLVIATDEPLSEHLLVPRRSPFNWRFGFALRPFLGLDAAVGSQSTKPVGFLLDAYAAWYLDQLPLAIELSVQPFGFAFNSGDAHYPTTFSLTAAYATDYFEIGLGAGGLVGNEGPCAYDPNTGAMSACEVNTGFTINQLLRLGALDGLSLTWRSSIFSRPDRFVFGVGRGEVNVPLTRKLGLFGAGGGGENGWMFGELGVRTYLGGTGARGTVLISASLGYAAVLDGPRGERAGGPAVAIGMEWRR